jgi:hypothetical protein
MASRMTRRSRYGWSLAGALVSLLVVNLKQFYGHHSSDFYVSDGWPFTFFNEGGFLHDSRFVWPGLLGDILLALAAGVGVGASWDRFAPNTRK